MAQSSVVLWGKVGGMVVRVLVTGIAAVAVVVAGCSGKSGGEGPGWLPSEISGEIVDPERMVVANDVVFAGDLLEVLFPRRDLRGSGLALEREVDGAWRWEYLISSSPDGTPGAILTAAEYKELVGGIGAAGIDDAVHRVPVPDGAPPGTYRICTADEPVPLCAGFVVADPTDG